MLAAGHDDIHCLEINDCLEDNRGDY